MPWFPDFVSAVEMARRDTQVGGRPDPVAQYLRALEEGNSHLLEKAWPGQIVVQDPRAGAVRSHRELRHFVSRNQAWLAEHHAHTEGVAETRVGRRAVVELLAHVDHDGRSVAWPLAVVADSPDERSVTIRTYCTTVPFDGHRQLRSPLLEPGADQPGDVVGQYQAALRAGDVDGIVQSFRADGYFQEPAGSEALHRGMDELRAFFLERFSTGGGLEVQLCEVTDDGERCALEYNLIRWGSHDLPPQAGIAVFERGPDGLLAAVRTYDDVEPPGVPANS
jgi:ketosteroid isomerase-like protein